MRPPVQDSAVASVPSGMEDTSNKILKIIYEHALNKFDDSKERLAAGTVKFLTVIDRFVQAGERVETCLPAFPFKSANKVYKVLGYHLRWHNIQRYVNSLSIVMT